MILLQNELRKVQPPVQLSTRVRGWTATSLVPVIFTVLGFGRPCVSGIHVCSLGASGHNNLRSTTRYFSTSKLSLPFGKVHVRKKSCRPAQSRMNLTEVHRTSKTNAHHKLPMSKYVEQARSTRKSAPRTPQCKAGGNIVGSCMPRPKTAWDTRWDIHWT